MVPPADARYAITGLAHEVKNLMVRVRILLRRCFKHNEKLTVT